MDADTFYEEFKAALDFLGVGFRGKDQVTVGLDGGKLCLVLGGKEARIALPAAPTFERD
jgi:hypothetical protein